MSVDSSISKQMSLPPFVFLEAIRHMAAEINRCRLSIVVSHPEYFPGGREQESPQKVDW